MANASEVDLSPDEAEDSGFEDSASLQSTSLASSVLNYTYENGRRYHAYRAGSYPLPNDEQEQDRMDSLHHIWLSLLGGELLYRKPPNLERVLDVGTGTGSWAIHMADEYPQATIIGTDLSPIQPGWVPPNCRFYVDDAESDWTYSPFDLIHARSLTGSIADWPRFYRQCFETLRPGGYLEIQEHDVQASTIEKELPPWTAEMNANLSLGSDLFGRPMNVAHLHANWVREAGFVEVEEQLDKVPIGSWAKHRKELGRFHLSEILTAIEPYCLALYTKALSKSYEETKVAIEMVKQEFCTKKHHLYINFRFITGRKPA